MSHSEEREEGRALHPCKPEPSCVSMKSNISINMPPDLSDGAVTSDPVTACEMSHSEEREEGRALHPCTPEPSCVSMKSNKSTDTPPDLSDGVVTSDPVETETEDLQQDDVKQRVKAQHKAFMKHKYESLFEGIKLQENETLLSKIYTQLYIIEGESKGVNEEHEVLHMEKKLTTQHSQDAPIYCNDIFNPLHEADQREKIKSVLTKGIAGIGKTVSVQKFILDWAEGTANQDVDFMFVLPFRELNLIQKHHCSLHKLLLDFHPELKDLDSKIYDECKVVFIFDGLDESRITLKFTDREKVSDVTETSSLSVLMSNLIKGDLLPSALIWITSRPAAAHQIPSEYISRVTEIQGFNDLQKEEYFRKRISNESQASRIISHIRRARSLHIMCHIPVFCWISSTVLQNILTQDHSGEIPKTLTEMYIHFLLMYGEKDNRDPEEPLQSNCKVILKLAEVAYKQLMKGNVMFYEEDLRECGIDITNASVYSGICTEIFKEESVIHRRKLFCFIHLSFQEFLAAFHVFYCFVNNTSEDLKVFNLLANLHKGVIDAALQRKNGHLDLFLRFLLGISLESNQKLLQVLLKRTESSSECIQRIITYIKDKIKIEQLADPSSAFSAGRSINLFLCLLEMNDQSLSKEILLFLESEKRTENKLSASHCSTIAYMLQVSENVLEELNLMKYNTSQEGRWRLLPAVMNCKKALLSGCDMTAEFCEIVASALQLLDSPLRELDLSNNDLWDSGVKILCEGLKNPSCRLDILRLSGCLVTEEGCCYLASALRSNPSHLRELDLSYNHPGPSGVQLLSDRLNDPQCTLNKLNLDHVGSFMTVPGLQKYTCHLSLDPNTANTRLVLSEEKRTVTCVEEEQLYPDYPERFEYHEQIMCKEHLSGRCYWEVEWTGGCYVAVTYRGIKRKGGNYCVFGWNKKSWGLFCTRDRFSAWHNNRNTDIHVQSGSYNSVGVYLDEPAGILSFYGVSDLHTRTHLYTFHTEFTEPVYAGFAVYGSMSLLG